MFSEGNVEEGELFANSVGDSFLNKCMHENKFFRAFENLYTCLLGWSEPYPLLLLNLLLLIILPAIFRVGSFLKISRLYNITRLGLLSLFHQIGYSYTAVLLLALIIRQPSPCILSYKDIRMNEYSLPSILAGSAAMFLFAVTDFAGLSPIVSLCIWVVFFTFQSIVLIADRFASVFQAMVTILICYLLHKWHSFLPFKYIHIENGVLFVANLVCTILYAVYDENEDSSSLFFNIWFTYLVLLIDEFLIARHQITRGSFSAIERPGDLKWTIETEHVESIRLLNSEEEEMFTKNVSSDLKTSIAAFTLFFAGVFVRRIVASTNFFQSN